MEGAAPRRPPLSPPACHPPRPLLASPLVSPPPRVPPGTASSHHPCRGSHEVSYRCPPSLSSGLPVRALHHRAWSPGKPPRFVTATGPPGQHTPQPAGLSDSLLGAKPLPGAPRGCPEASQPRRQPRGRAPSIPWPRPLPHLRKVAGCNYAESSSGAISIRQTSVVSFSLSKAFLLPNCSYRIIA